MPPDLNPSAGGLDGVTYVFPLRVYYEDTDFSGVVYHASYLRFLERGRSEFLRSIGLGHDNLLKASEPLAWAVRRITIDFDKPARIEEALHVRTSLLELSGARMHLHQDIMRGADLLIKADVEVCVITLDGKPRRIPEMVRDKMRSFMKG